MGNVMQKLLEELKSAREAATMENMSLGFPNDRVQVVKVLFQSGHNGEPGIPVHPTEYVRKITDLYCRSWIIGPIDRAINLLEANAALIEKAERVAVGLEKLQLGHLADLARAARNTHYD